MITWLGVLELFLPNRSRKTKWEKSRSNSNYPYYDSYDIPADEYSTNPLAGSLSSASYCDSYTMEYSYDSDGIKVEGEFKP